MRDLFELSMPWWEFVVRGALSYLSLLVALRLTADARSARWRHSTSSS
jgi:hypothetical protein